MAQDHDSNHDHRDDGRTGNGGNGNGSKAVRDPGRVGRAIRELETYDRVLPAKVEAWIIERELDGVPVPDELRYRLRRKRALERIARNDERDGDVELADGRPASEVVAEVDADMDTAPFEAAPAQGKVRRAEDQGLLRFRIPL